MAGGEIVAVVIARDPATAIATLVVEDNIATET